MIKTLQTRRFLDDVIGFGRLADLLERGIGNVVGAQNPQYEILNFLEGTVFGTMSEQRPNQMHPYPWFPQTTQIAAITEPDAKTKREREKKPNYAPPKQIIDQLALSVHPITQLRNGKTGAVILGSYETDLTKLQILPLAKKSATHKLSNFLGAFSKQTPSEVLAYLQRKQIESDIGRVTMHSAGPQELVVQATGEKYIFTAHFKGSGPKVHMYFQTNREESFTLNSIVAEYRAQVKALYEQK